MSRAVADVPSLQEFADALDRERDMPWPERNLPVEIQEQIITATTSVRRTIAWLHSIGYPDATVSRIDEWRRTKRAERAERDRGNTR